MLIKCKLKELDSFEMVIDEKLFKSKNGFIVLPECEAVKSFIEKGILGKIEEIKEKPKKIEEKSKKRSRKKKKDKGDK